MRGNMLREIVSRWSRWAVADSGGTAQALLSGRMLPHASVISTGFAQNHEDKLGMSGSRSIWSSAVSNAVKRTKRTQRRARPAARPPPVIIAPGAYLSQVDRWKQAFQLPDIILKRDIELGDLLVGFEQARQMSLNTPDDQMLLAVVEEPGGLFSGALVRQLFEASRAFTFDVFALDSPQPTVLYRIRREFPWLNFMAWLFREITVEDAQGNVVASVTRNWHPFYRNYDLYYVKDVGYSDDVELTMFSAISVPFWTAMFTWTYPMLDGAGNVNGVIERNLGQGLQGAAVQIFTEKGNYLLAVRDRRMGVHQRLAMIACAISVDYDHYSRRVGGGLLPFMFLPGGGSDD